METSQDSIRDFRVVAILAIILLTMWGVMATSIQRIYYPSAPQPPVLSEVIDSATTTVVLYMPEDGYTPVTFEDVVVLSYEAGMISFVLSEPLGVTFTHSGPYDIIKVKKE